MLNQGRQTSGPGTRTGSPVGPIRPTGLAQPIVGRPPMSLGSAHGFCLFIRKSFLATIAKCLVLVGL